MIQNLAECGLAQKSGMIDTCWAISLFMLVCLACGDWGSKEIPQQPHCYITEIDNKLIQQSIWGRWQSEEGPNL